MTALVLITLNIVLIIFFTWLLQRPGLLGYAKGGKWLATWLTVGVITLMDELTSVFYAPAEAHRFIGQQAIFFIALTSIVMRVVSSRMVEIGQILERNEMRGGGVYSFSYLVLGPAASFVAVASRGFGSELARHCAGLLVPGVDRGSGYTSGLGAGALGPDRRPRS